MATNDLTLRIGADDQDLQNTLTAARESSSRYASSFKGNASDLNATLRDLNTTMAQVASNTRQAADATQHLSNVTNFLLTITGVKLIGDAFQLAGKGVIFIGQEVGKAAVSFDAWARSEAYVIGQTNAVRVENDKAGASYQRLVAYAVDFGASYVGIRSGLALGASAISGTATVIRGLSSALSIAASAVVDLGVTLASRLLTPMGLLRAAAAGLGAEGILRLSAAYGRASQAVQDYGRWVQIYKSAELEAAATTLTLAGNLQRFSTEVKKLNFDNTTRGVQYFMSELAKVPGMTDKTAAAIEASFATLPNFSGPLNEALVQAIRLIATTETQAKELADAFVKAFTNPDANGEAFLRSLGNVDAKLLDNFKHAQRTGEAFKMQAALLDGIVVLTERARENATRRAEEEIKAMGMSREQAIARLGPFNDAIRLSKELNDEADKQNQKLVEQTERVRNLAPAWNDVYQKALDISKAYNTPTAALEHATGRLNIMERAIAGTGETAKSAAEYIKQFESLRTQAYPDEGGKWTIGVGQTRLHGRAVREGDVISQEEAYQSLVDYVERDQAILESRLGDSWGRLSVRAKQALLSVTYQYGLAGSSAANSAIEAARSGNLALADAIERLPPTVNKKFSQGVRNRLDKQAAYIRGDDPEMLEARDAVKREVKTLNEAQAGGSDISKYELEVMQNHVKGISDEIDEHRKLAELLEREVAQETDKLKKTELQKRLASEQNQIRELGIAHMRRDAELKAAPLEHGSKERHAILMNELNEEAKLRAKEPDRLKEIEARKVAIEDEAEKASAREKMLIEDEKYQDTLTRLRKEADAFKDAAHMKRLDDTQLKEALDANARQRLEADMAHWKEVQRIQGENTVEFERAQRQMTRAAQREALQRAADAREEQKETFNNYQSAFESVGNTVSSSLMGVVTRHQTMRQAVGAILQSLTQMAVSEVVKRSAAWAAGIATEVTLAQGAEVSKTAAVATGESARSGLLSAGVVASAVARGASAIKSILSSAAESFAGVFAFLSPLMGPAAAGPAAAAEAAVAGVTSMVAFDIGAWNIPQTMPALVHRGELVMPAAEAGAFRTAMSAMAGGGGAGAPGGSGHVFNISPQVHIAAMDSHDVMRALKGVGGRNLSKVLSDAVVNGAHLGMRGLNPR